MNDDKRPNPEALLKSVSKIESQKGKGSLRIFFGMCPGVGKTYSMLRAAAERQKSGKRVLVGLVETHNRLETQALLENLTVLPRKSIRYKDRELLEMDTDEILKQKPDLVVVDELAHTNAPGSRHSKRYQDVEEILNAGIDVYTTLNVQHIESRSDLVQQITGIPIRETVPDKMLEIADQIEVIDLSPSELLKRLKEGKVYLGERAEQAAQNFFKEEHLTALREMALRFTAEKVDHELQEHMAVKQIAGPWNTNERLLVAISQSPFSQRLLRATRRMAYNLEAPWVALFVDTGIRLSDSDYSMLQKNIALAKRLGAEVVTTIDTDVGSAIRRVALERNITQIVMGRPDRRFFKDILTRGSLLDQLVRETSQIDVHVLRQDRKPRYQGFRVYIPEFQSGLMKYAHTLFFFVGVLVVGKILEPMIGYRAVGFLFLLGILLVSSIANRGPILLAAVVSALVWNFVFIPPKFTFVISSYEDLMLVGVYFFVASLGGILTTRIRRQKKLLRIREERTNTLFQLARDLSEAKSKRDIFKATRLCIQKVFKSQIKFWTIDNEFKLKVEEDSASDLGELERDTALVEWSFQNQQKAGWSTDTLAGSKCLSLPLIGKNQIIGVMLFYPTQMRKMSIEQESFLDAIIQQVAITLERDLLDQKAEAARFLERSEKLHQVLLNSVSHELRTPLTSIIGNATALQDEKSIENPATRRSLVQELILSTERLNRIVDNLLDMSRIDSGTLQLKKEWFDIRELMDDAVKRFERNLLDRKIILDLGSDPVYYSGDYRLIDQVLTNLILNALAYSQSDIGVSLKAALGKIQISVADNGIGISLEDQPRIFEKFYRASHAPTGGVGLGLSIVKTIVDLHGGSVLVKSEGVGRGTTFVVELPLVDPPARLAELTEVPK